MRSSPFPLRGFLFVCVVYGRGEVDVSVLRMLLPGEKAGLEALAIVLETVSRCSKGALPFFQILRPQQTNTCS